MDSLLKKASIIITPTAHNVGSINAIKPIQTIGVELGDDSTITNAGNAVMTKISNLNYNATSDGTQTSSIRPRLGFNNTIVGSKYKISIKATNKSGTILFKLFNGSSYVISGNDLSSDIDFIFTAQSTSTVNFNFDGREVFNVDLEISLKQIINADLDFERATSGSVVGTAQREKADGVLEQVAENVPRIDYTGGVAHWLIEPQSRNLITYSEDFLNSNWQHNSALNITANATTSPNGAINATRVEYSGSGSRLGVDIALTSGNSYTLSFYAKNNGGTANLNVRVDGQSLPLQPYTITDDFERYEFTFTATATATSEIRLFTSTTGIDAFIWGAQLEELSYATSYIPTSAQTVTREKDSFGLNTTLDTSLIDSTEGTFYVEMAALDDNQINRIVSLSEGNNNNTIRVRFEESVSNKIRIDIKTQSGQSSIYSTTSYDILNFSKIGVRFKTNDCACFVNGTELTASSGGSTGDTYPANTLTKIESSRGGGSLPFEGKIKCIAVFKEGLTDAELTCLTT